MSTLSAGKINSYAQLAGFSGQDVNIAVAVALAESGGNPNAHNSTPPDDSYGLWQINMLGALGPARRKQFGISSNQELFDPAKNARAAYAIWRSSGWNAWTTYTRGTYKKYMDQVSNGSIPGAVSDVKEAASGINPMAGVTSAINAVGQNIFKGTASALGILVAVVLLVLGIVLLARKQIPAGKIIKKVTA